MRIPALSLLSFVLVLAACSSSKEGDEAQGSETGDAGPAPLGAPAAAIGITKVSINQGVEVALFAEGSDVTDLNARLVQGRRALVRVYVEPLDGWISRDHQGVLTLVGEQGTTRYEDLISIEVLSNEAQLDSTLNFEIPAEDLQGEQSMSVAIYEVDDASHEGDSSRSMWPSTGEYVAPFEDVGALRITLVPIQYDADGSGRLPDVDAAQLQRYEDLFMAMYPVPAVELTLADPFPWGGAIGAGGNGWQQLLLAMTNLRGALQLGNDQYIYGLMAPADSFAQFCGVGCVAGLSLLGSNPSDAMARSSIGLGFTGDEAALTMAHEVGHAHGREHAPCGLLGQPSDPNYPYSNAQLGVWGWDGVNGALKGPTAYSDIMAYCMPSWLSDYTYDALLERSLAVNVAGMADVGELREWSAAWVDEQGRLSPASDLLLPEHALASEGARVVRFLAADGAQIGEARAREYTLSDLPGGLLVWPRTPTDVRSVAVDGFAPLVLR